jgi:Mg-chelatase subunit ChlD
MESKTTENDIESNGFEVVNMPLEIQSNYNSKTDDLLVTINVPERDQKAERVPTHICMVVDVSGSMGSRAETKTSSGETEEYGMSLLDIVRQSAKVIVGSLKPDDRVSLISFHSSATVEFSNIQLKNSDDKKHIYNKLDKLIPRATTNLWDGLYKAQQMFHSVEKQSSLNKRIILLTDGIPNVIPPAGHVAMLQRLRDEYGELVPTDTCGFGCALNSRELNLIAKECNGKYTFIPDSGFVGTILVNLLANAFTTYSPISRLTIEMNTNNWKLEKIGGDSDEQLVAESWGYNLPNICLNYGQSRHLLFKLTPKVVDNTTSNCNLILTLGYWDRTNMIVKEAQSKLITTNDKNIANTELQLETELQRIRLQTVSESNDYNRLQKWISSVKSLDWLSNNSNEVDLANRIRSTEYYQNIIKDLDDQIPMAYKREYYNKWGKHYIPSLLSAYNLEQFNNFKDNGVKNFGGQMFKKVQLEIENVFMTLPAPKQSISTAKKITASSYTNVYYDEHGGCFHGNCLVSITDLVTKRCDRMQVGDMVMTPNGTSRVEYILKTVYINGFHNLVTLKSGWIGTPWHPIKHNGEWTYPNSIVGSKHTQCDAVYSFVLENRSSIHINGIESATLGHNNTENNVITHEFFGTDRIIESLKKLDQKNDGYITITPEWMMRDSDTEKYCDIRQP